MIAIVIFCMALLSLACAPTMHTLIPPRQRVWRTKSNLQNAARYVNYELVTMVTDKLA